MFKNSSYSILITSEVDVKLPRFSPTTIFIFFCTFGTRIVLMGYSPTSNEARPWKKSGAAGYLLFLRLIYLPDNVTLQAQVVFQELHALRCFQVYGGHGVGRFSSVLLRYCRERSNLGVPTSEFRAVFWKNRHVTVVLGRTCKGKEARDSRVRAIKALITTVWRYCW